MTKINNYEEKIISLQEKIISLQDLMIKKEEEIRISKEKGMHYYLKISNECSEKRDKISSLENEIFMISAFLSRQWKIPIDKAKERLINETKHLKEELGIN